MERQLILHWVQHPEIIGFGYIAEDVLDEKDATRLQEGEHGLHYDFFGPIHRGTSHQESRLRRPPVAVKQARILSALRTSMFPNFGIRISEAGGIMKKIVVAVKEKQLTILEIVRPHVDTCSAGNTNLCERTGRFL
jgi:hypothetical protein